MIKETILNNFLKKSLFIKLINSLMLGGKKTKAETILLKLIKLLKKKNKNPIKMLTKALNNAKTSLIIRTQKKRKMSRLVPTPISDKKQLNYAILNIIGITRKKLTKATHLQLLQELMNISKKKGPIMDYKKQLYKTAEENKLLTRFNKKIP